MGTVTVSLSKIKTNPNNPRLIRDGKFDKLKKSIENFPKMLQLREIIVDEDYMILGGNMRYKAMKELGIKECPIKVAYGLTEDEKKEFIVKDNSSFGDWDWDDLESQYSKEDLEDWGIDIIASTGSLSASFDFDTAKEVPDAIPYPITIIITEDDYLFWLKIKEEISEQGDRDAFLKIIKNMKGHQK